MVPRWSLSGVNRTWRGQPNSVENDPERKFSDPQIDPGTDAARSHGLPDHPLSHCGSYAKLVSGPWRKGQDAPSIFAAPGRVEKLPNA